MEMNKRSASPLELENSKEPRFFSPEYQRKQSAIGNLVESSKMDKHEQDFKTPVFGCKKDKNLANFVKVDVTKRNGEEYKASYLPGEAVTKIWNGCFGLEPSMLAGVSVERKNHPVLTFRLKEVQDVDKLFRKRIFKYKKRVEDENGCYSVVEIEVEVRGIRLETDDGAESASASGDPNIKWITIDTHGYDLDEEQVRLGMSSFGMLLTEFREQTLRFTEEEIEEMRDGGLEDLEPIGLGTYSVKMRMDREMPQLLPLGGKKIRVYYKGIRKLCNNCFEPGHLKRDCKKERVDWMAYIDMFKKQFEFADGVFLGRWERMHKDWLNKNTKTNCSSIQTQASDPEPCLTKAKLGRPRKDSVGKRGGRK